VSPFFQWRDLRRDFEQRQTSWQNRPQRSPIARRLSRAGILQSGNLSRGFRRAIKLWRVETGGCSTS
jgi:hypothetical protein